MKTLLQINTVSNWGSTGRITEDIGTTAIDNGWESFIAYGRGNPKSSSQLIRVGNDLELKFNVLQSRIFDNQGLTSSSSTTQLLKRIKTQVSDLA